MSNEMDTKYHQENARIAIRDSALSIHPGEILKEEFLEVLELSEEDFAEKSSIVIDDVKAIIANKKEIDVDTAYKLSAYFNTTAQFWLNLQRQYLVHKFEGKILQKHRAEKKKWNTKRGNTGEKFLY